MSDSASQTTISAAQADYLRKQRNTRIQIRLIQILIFIGFLILWEISADCHWINSFIFCSPSIIAKCFWEMLRDGILLKHIGITLVETLASF